MLTKGSFKHVESELYAYPDTKKEVQKIIENIMTRDRPSDENSLIRSGRIGDPTGQTATLLASHRTLEQLERIVDIIDEIVRKLPDEKLRMMKLRYWGNRKLTWEGIALELERDRRTVTSWRNQIVYLIAEKLGWR